MKRFLFTILLTGLTIILFAQAGNMEQRERVYVQTDKQYYLAGEQLLMKLLTLDTEQVPLIFSKVAYAELVRDTIAQVQIKIALSDGVGEGRMQLPVELPTGYYRLIAYTQYMRNEGVDVFFEKIIGVVNTFQPDYNPEKAKQQASMLNSQPLLQGMKQPILNSTVIPLQSDKTVYSFREHGELQLSGLPASIFSLSVSIARQEMIASDSFPIAENLPIKSPVFSKDYLPEYEGHILTGSLVDNQTGKAKQNNDFILALTFPGTGISFYTGELNLTGNVLFFTSGNYETKEIATIAYNEGDKYRIDLQSPFVTIFPPKNIPVLHIDSTCYDQLLERSVALQALHYFSDDSDENNYISEPFFKMKPTNSYPLDEYTRFTTMREVFIEFISNARFRRRNGKQELSVVVKSGDNSYYGSNPLVFLDGIPISNHELIYNYDPLLVEYINIYNNLFILGGYTFEGIVELKTYRGLMQDLNFDKSTQIIPYEGLQFAKIMQNPDYSIVKNNNNRIPDSRHTLLWNPDIQTEGQSTIRIPFDTSDISGEYKATVEGLTKDGEMIIATSFFKVE